MNDAVNMTQSTVEPISLFHIISLFIGLGVGYLDVAESD
jgi:hypothetical protein